MPRSRPPAVGRGRRSSGGSARGSVRDRSRASPGGSYRDGARGTLVGRAGQKPPRGASRRAVSAVQQVESSSEEETSESENDERSSASEFEGTDESDDNVHATDSSADDSDEGDDRMYETEISSGGSLDVESGSGSSASEDEAHMAEDTDETLQSRVEVRVHVHEAKELTPMDGSTSDPYAYVTCFGQSKQTKTASKGTDAVWDEELQFSGTTEDLEGGVLSVAVWDEDFGADDLIGSFDFALEHVRKRPYKEYYKTWITLFNSGRDGPQGKVRVSITILEPGDELPPRPGSECSEDSSRMQTFDLHVRCYCAEGLPRMDRRGLADPYVSLFWCGRKVRTPEAADTLNPEFYQELALPVNIEGNPEAPPGVDLVVVRIREYNRTGNVDIAYGSLYLSDIKKSAWRKPCWLNLYGAPRLHCDGVLGGPTIAGKGSIILEQMNSGKKAGNTYRGRVLLSAELRTASSDNQVDGSNTEFDPKPVDKPVRAGTVAVPRRYPAVPVGVYTLRVALLVGCDLPVRQEMVVRVSWGVPKTGATRDVIASGTGDDQISRKISHPAGAAIWNELLTLQVEWPLDPWQVPDVFVELIDRNRKIRTHFLRIGINDIDDIQDMIIGSSDRPAVNGKWYTLVRSTTEHVDPALCEPRLLMCVGIECDKEIRRAAFDAQPDANDEKANRWRNLWQIKAPYMRGKQNGMNEDDRPGRHPKGNAAKLRRLSVSALRRFTGSAGVSKSDLRFARESGEERCNLTAMLLDHLMANGGYASQANHQFFQMRVHVYQARHLRLADQRGPMPVVVAHMWDTHSIRATIDKQTTPAREGNPQSPCWYQSLAFDRIQLPGSKAGHWGLRMAYPLLLYIQQHDNSRQSVAAPIGRLRIPILDIRAKFERPKWVRITSPHGAAAGELLVGVEMYAETQRIPRVMPNLRPTMTPVNITVVLIGGRNLKDTNPTLGERFGSSVVRSSKVEFRPGAEEIRSTAKSDGSNPTYLHVETWRSINLPEDELYAPSLSAQVFHDVGMMSTALLGIAEINLAKHIRKFFQNPHQLLSTTISNVPHPEPEPEPEPEPGLVQWKPQSRRARNGRPYTKLDSSEESESSGSSDESERSEGSEANWGSSVSEASSSGDTQALVRDFDAKSATRGSPYQKGSRPFFAKRQGKPWKRFVSLKAAAEHLKVKPKQLSKCLSKQSHVKGIEFKYAVEAEGVKKLDPAWRIGRERALDELENCYPEILDTYEDLDIKSQDSRENVVSAGTLKAWIGLWDTRVPGPHHPQAEKMSTVVEVTVRAYIVRAFRLTAKDAGNSSDPYVMATLDGEIGSWPTGHPDAGKQVEKFVLSKTLNPYFGQVFEWKNVKIPGTPALRVEVLDDDMLADDLVGVTEVDIEERFLSQEWQRLGVSDDNVVRKPSECRDLFYGDSRVTQGSIEMWVEAFPASDAARYPLVDISPPQKELFELRVVIWDAKDMVSMDTLGDDMNDLFISAHLYYRDSLNRLQETVQETDVHWRAQGGKGSFNYRLLFPDLELPMDDGSADSDLPKLVLRAWDQDVIGDKDLIGSTDIDVRDMFRAGWKRLKEQQGRDDEIRNMSDDELKHAVSEMWDAEFEHATSGKQTAAKKQKRNRIQKNRTKLSSMSRAKMRTILVQSDPKRSLSYTSVRLPDPHNSAQAMFTASAFEADTGCRACCADTADELGAAAREIRRGVRAALLIKPSRECCIDYLQCQCLPDLCGSLCRAIRYFCYAICTCRKCVTDKIVDTIRTDPVAEHKPLVVNVIGANLSSDSSDDTGGSDEDVRTDDLGDVTWGSCGQVRLQMELLPKALANERPAGKGRDEPNQFPTLPEPVGRAELSLNPYTMLVQLVGPSFAAKLVTFCVAIGCCILVLVMIPLILSNIIAHITEHAMGI